MLYSNYYFKYLIDFLKAESKEVESIFILSWNCIYATSKEGYEKLDFSFESNIEYIKIIENVFSDYNVLNNDEIYINAYKNIDVYLHKWNSNSYWITLKKR